MTKTEKYETLVDELGALLAETDDLTANLANASALIASRFHAFSWVGFYLRKKEELILGPFQGLPACVSIPLGRGVCGTSASRKETLIVPDVHLFPGHIACDATSRSEIVVPLIHDGFVVGVLDVDSHDIARFDAVDQIYLEKIAAILVKKAF
ncbi:MAG: GAF domain-containing protein [Firmicutes bacterium]|nr:GAF domain-containing protein [Bacillota bacterium]